MTAATATAPASTDDVLAAMQAQIDDLRKQVDAYIVFVKAMSGLITGDDEREAVWPDPATRAKLTPAVRRAGRAATPLALHQGGAR